MIQVVVSDFHSGSNHALFPDRIWGGNNGNTHAPNSKQMKIRKHFEAFCADVKSRRKDKKIKLIHNGDAIDGDHHNSNDVCTRDILQQADIHIELMNELQKRIGWQRGDEIFYTKGTQTHVNEREQYIADQMNAGEVHNFLKLETNGVLSWFAHHGPRAGKGPNEGNAVYNWLKAVYYDELKEGTRVPDIIYTGHVHKPTYAPFGYRLEGFKFRVLHGVIVPSWQSKTVYAWEKAAIERNRIGGVIHEIKEDGTITVPVFSVIET